MSNDLSFIPDEKYINDEYKDDYMERNYSLDFDSRIMPCKRELIDFLDRDNDICRSKNHHETNIIDIQRGKCYSFENKSNKLELFFHRLEECRRQGITIMFNEKQNSNGSGLMFDFDLKLKNPNNFK